MQAQLAQVQKDALKEMVSIGAGNAATALSQMIKKKIDIVVPKVNFTAIEQASEVFGEKETPVTAIYLQLLGELSGVILFSLSNHITCRLINLLTGQKIKPNEELNEIAKSSLKETGTIVSGAYVNAIARMLNLRLLISAPAFACDMAGAIVDNILIETSKEADHAMIINTELNIIDEKVAGYFFFIPEVESLNKMLKILNTC